MRWKCNDSATLRSRRCSVDDGACLRLARKGSRQYEAVRDDRPATSPDRLRHGLTDAPAQPPVGPASEVDEGRAAGSGTVLLAWFRRHGRSGPRYPGSCERRPRIRSELFQVERHRVGSLAGMASPHPDPLRVALPRLSGLEGLTPVEQREVVGDQQIADFKAL